jgi:hypothetical protein
MRYFTIILAVMFGMMLSWIMLLNPQIVQVRLDSVGANGLSWLQEPVRAMPMWQVIFWSVAIGIAIGFLLTWSGGAENRRRLKSFEYDKERAVADDDEPDYVVGLTSRRR